MAQDGLNLDALADEMRWMSQALQQSQEQNALLQAQMNSLAQQQQQQRAAGTGTQPNVTMQDLGQIFASITQSERMWRAIFFRIFSFFFRIIFVFSGSVAFRLFGFCGFYVGFCGFCGFSFRIICIHSSSLFASSALPVPLRQVAFWLFGFLAFGGFLALAFRILMLSQLVFGLGFLHHQHRKFLSGPPATPLSIKMQSLFDHHATATF